MAKVTVIIDGQEIIAREGQKLLAVALENGLYIPNLCAIDEAREPAASCRLCYVEVEGRAQPVTACTEPVVDGLRVNTHGERARRLARTAFELLLSNHEVDCAHCPRNGNCELQRIAAYLKVGLRSNRLPKLERGLDIDDSSPLFTYNPNKCVLCGRCVWVCREKVGVGALGFAHRGYQRVMTTFGGRPMVESGCGNCAACVAVCPVGALVMKPTDRSTS